MCGREYRHVRDPTDVCTWPRDKASASLLGSNSWPPKELVINGTVPPPPPLLVQAHAIVSLDTGLLENIFIEGLQWHRVTYLMACKADLILVF